MYLSKLLYCCDNLLWKNDVSNHVLLNGGTTFQFNVWQDCNGVLYSICITGAPCDAGYLPSSTILWANLNSVLTVVVDGTRQGELTRWDRLWAVSQVNTCHFYRLPYSRLTIATLPCESNLHLAVEYLAQLSVIHRFLTSRSVGRRIWNRRV